MSISVSSIVAAIGSLGKLFEIVKYAAKRIKNLFYKNKRNKIDEAESPQDFEGLI